MTDSLVSWGRLRGSSRDKDVFEKQMRLAMGRTRHESDNLRVCQLTEYRLITLRSTSNFKGKLGKSGTGPHVNTMS